MQLGLVILAITLSLDSLFIGISYSSAGIKIPFLYKLILCFFSVFYAALALILGDFINELLPKGLTEVAGGIILVIMGLYLFIKAFFDSNKESEMKSISLKETLILSFTLSLDSIGVGIGIAISGIAYAIMPFIIGAFQILFLYAGSVIGKILKKSLDLPILSYIPGIVIIIIGILRIM